MKKTDRKKAIVTFLIVAALAMATMGVLVPKVHAVNDLIMRRGTDPAIIDDPTLGPGSNITINAYGSNMENIFTWQITLKFNPAILQCTGAGVASGMFLFAVTPSPIVNNVLGEVSLGSSLIFGDGVSGSDVFAVFNLTVVGRGTSVLDFAEPGIKTYMLNPPQQDQPISVTNGSFTNFVPPPTARIFINPPSIVDPNLIAGDSFSVDLNIESGTDVHNWTANIAYVNTILSASGVVEGSFLSNVGLTIFSLTIQNDFNATHGMIQLSCTLGTGGATGNGVLATITFDVLDLGQSPITLSDVTLFDSAGTALPFTTADGFFNNVGVRDIIVLSVTPRNTVIAHGFPLNITVEVRNGGDFNETFSVNATANGVLVAPSQLVQDLMPGTNATLVFIWDTTSFALGDYEIQAAAEFLAGESTAANNVLLDGTVHVVFPGDVSGAVEGTPDGVVDMRDIGYIADKYNTFPEDPDWDPYADQDGNGRVDLRDIAIACVNFMAELPS
jgi:hypothetical protein